jgi:hypothetical protein
MMETEETRTNLSNDTETSPQRGWLKRGFMPVKPATTPAASRRKEAQEFNSLTSVWERSVHKLQPLRYHKPVTFRQGCMLATVGRSVGPQAPEVIQFAIANWNTFVSETTRTKGLFGSQPEEPAIRFFVAHHDCAVNLLWQSVAEKKQDKEREAKSEEPGTQVHAHRVLQSNIKQNPDNFTCIGHQGCTLPESPETVPIALYLTHEQAAFLCDFSKDHDAFFATIAAKYGGCIIRGLASKELLARAACRRSRDGSVQWQGG